VAGSGEQATPAVAAAAAAALPVRIGAVGAKARAPRGATAPVALGVWAVSAPTSGSAAKWGAQAAALAVDCAVAPAACGMAEGGEGGGGGGRARRQGPMKGVARPAREGRGRGGARR